MANWGQIPNSIGGIAVISSLDMLIIDGIDVAPGAASWPAVNRGLFMPVKMPHAFTVTAFFWYNGAALSGNIDAGLFDAGYRRLISTGATLQAGASALQSVDTTDATFPSGLYYLALWAAATGASILRIAAGINNTRLLGVFQDDTGATTLPALSTPAILVSNYIPMCGMRVIV